MRLSKYNYYRTDKYKDLNNQNSINVLMYRRRIMVLSYNIKGVMSIMSIVNYHYYMTYISNTSHNN